MARYSVILSNFVCYFNTNRTIKKQNCFVKTVYVFLVENEGQGILIIYIHNVGPIAVTDIIFEKE